MRPQNPVAKEARKRPSPAKTPPQIHATRSSNLKIPWPLMAAHTSIRPIDTEPTVASAPTDIEGHACLKASSVL
ncbi:MAG: hypothetical protein ACK55Z_00160, partial [bacterium]